MSEHRDDGEDYRRHVIERAASTALEHGAAVDIRSGLCVDLPHPEPVIVPDVVIVERFANGIEGPGPGEQSRTDADGRRCWLFAEGVTA